jgi:ankyrin repeat protein
MASKPKKKSTLKDYTGEVKAELQLDPHSCALIAAARRGDTLFGMLAMDAGDTINSVNNDEETALHVALENGHQVKMSPLHVLAQPFNGCLIASSEKWPPKP